MTKSFIKLFIMVLFTFFPGLGIAGSSTSAPLIKVVVANADISEPSFISSGSIILGRSLLRLLIDVPETGTLTVSFDAPGHARTTIVDSQAVSAGGTVALPSRDTWFPLDDSNGQATFTVSINKNGITNEDTFKFLQVSEDLPANSFVKEGISNETLLEPLASEYKAASDNERTFKIASSSLKKLENIILTKGTALRGASGARIFRNYARSVVLIVNDEGIGSGVLVNGKGQIITNWHVVGSSQDVGIVIKPNPGEKIKKKDIYLGRVVKVDQVRDLALVEVNNFPKDVAPVPLGKLKTIEIAADVHAIGHPTGESWTYTQGIVSQLRAGYKWVTQPGLQHEATVVQTQTPINPGNSGGPLFSDDGNLIGINSFVRKNAQGLNYAVSIRDVHEFIASRSDRIVLKDSKKTDECVAKTEKIDQDKNGKSDGLAADTDCDGTIDTVVIDSNEDGNPEKIIKDTNGDGKIDLTVLKSDPEGPFDVWLIDKDGDEKADVGGVDTNGDGKPDKFRDLT